MLLNTCGSAGVGLSVARSYSVVTISWPFPATTGYVLESRTSVISTNWQTASETAATNNGRLEVFVPLDQQARFFRLRKP